MYAAVKLNASLTLTAPPQGKYWSYLDASHMTIVVIVAGIFKFGLGCYQGHI